MYKSILYLLFPLSILFSQNCNYVGDANNDDITNIIDIVFSINCILDNQFCTCSNINQDQEIDILDITYLVTLIPGSEQGTDAPQIEFIINENKNLQTQLFHSFELIGCSQNIEEIRDQIEKLSNSESRIFISGPIGSGKELIAKALHEFGNRKDSTFVPINMAAIPKAANLKVCLRTVFAANKALQVN